MSLFAIRSHPFVLSLSKHRPSSIQEERQPPSAGRHGRPLRTGFDKLRANGDVIPNAVVAQEALA